MSLLGTIVSRVAARMTRTSPSNEMKRAPEAGLRSVPTFLSGLPYFQTYSAAARGQAAKNGDSDEQVNNALLYYPPIKNKATGFCDHS